MAVGQIWFEKFNGSISSKVQGFNYLKGVIGSRVQLVQGFNRFKGSIGSRVQMVQGFNWFKGSIGSRVHLVQGLNWIKVWMKVILGDLYIDYQSALISCGLKTLCDRRKIRCLNFAQKSLKHPRNARLFPLNVDNDHYI